MKPILALTLLLCQCLHTHAQIKLPKGFRCVLGTNHINESHFKKGDFIFRTYPHGHEGLEGHDVIVAVEDLLDHKVKLQKTTDGLYWGTGKTDEYYVYTVVYLDNSMQYTLLSKTNGKEFSDYSTWLLKQVREAIAKKGELYLTDANGRSCSGMK